MRSSPKVFIQQISLQYNCLDTGKMYCVVTVLFQKKSVYVCVCVCCWCSVMSESFRPSGLSPSRLLCPWTFPDKNTGVGCHFILQRILPTKGLNPHLLCLPHCRHIFHCSATGEVLDRILHFFLSFWMMEVLLIYYGRIIWICL